MSVRSENELKDKVRSKIVVVISILKSSIVVIQNENMYNLPDGGFIPKTQFKYMLVQS